MTQTIYGWDGDTLAFESRADAANGIAGSGVHYIHEPGSFVPLIQVRSDRPVALRPTTDVKALMALMAFNGGCYDIDLDPLWNGDLERK